MSSRMVCIRNTASVKKMGPLHNTGRVHVGFIKVDGVQTSGGVTGGFGWVQTHPLSKKGTHEIFANPKTFLGVWGEGCGGVGLREKKHELCQIVLNKQQNLHDAIIAFNFDH